MERYIYLFTFESVGEFYIIAPSIFRAVELAERRVEDHEALEAGFTVKMLSIAYPGDEVVE